MTCLGLGEGANVWRSVRSSKPIPLHLWLEMASGTVTTHGAEWTKMIHLDFPSVAPKTEGERMGWTLKKGTIHSFVPHRTFPWSLKCPPSW